MRGTGQIGPAVAGSRQSTFIEQMMTPAEVDALGEAVRNWTSAGVIAQWMRENNVTGTPGLMTDCPIANATKRIPGFLRVEMDDTDLWVQVRIISGQMITYHQANTPAMKSFIEHFDHGDFPDLVSKSDDQPVTLDPRTFENLLGLR